MKRLYVDMDGTLAVFNNQIESEEVLYQEGYYRDLPPQQHVVDAVRQIQQSNFDVEVFVLSAVLPSPYAEIEKNAWLDERLPEIDQAHRIFVPCGEDKGQYIGHALGDDDLLLDNYSKNLHSWCPPGRAIKLMNGINGNFGTWQGESISADDPTDEIVAILTGKLLELPSPLHYIGSAGYTENGKPEISFFKKEVGQLTLNDLTQITSKQEADQYVIAGAAVAISPEELSHYHISFLKIGRDISPEALEDELWEEAELAMINMKSAAALAVLPEKCYVYVASTNEIGIVKRGEMGYYPTDIYPPVGVELLNEELGVTKAQATAMTAGAMFGWDIPAADPANYDVDGHAIKPAAQETDIDSQKPPASLEELIPEESENHSQRVSMDELCEDDLEL